MLSYRLLTQYVGWTRVWCTALYQKIMQPSGKQKNTQLLAIKYSLGVKIGIIPRNNDDLRK